MTEESLQNALSAVQDESLKIMGILNEYDIHHKDEKLDRIRRKVDIIESICRHGIDVRSTQEIAESSE